MSNLQVILVALLAASALINYVDRQSVAVVDSAPDPGVPPHR